MNTKKKSTIGNPQKKGRRVYLVRKSQPSLPHGATSSYSGPNLILDFLGADISPDRREVFSSIVLSKDIALDIKKRLDAYLEYIELYEQNGNKEPEDNKQ